MKIIEKKINEGATNSDIYRAVKKMVENTYYKSRNYEVINTILAETFVELFDSVYLDTKKVIKNLISKLNDII